MNAIDLMFWRQAANNYLLIMDLVLDGILALYVLSYFRAYGWKEALKMTRVRAAAWIGIHVIGLTMQRAWGVVLLRAVADGKDVMTVEGHIPLFFIGSVIAVIGLAGTIYTFTPLAGESCGFWKNISPLILACIAAALFTFLMQHV